MTFLMTYIITSLGAIFALSLAKVKTTFKEKKICPWSSQINHTGARKKKCVHLYTSKDFPKDPEETPPGMKLALSHLSLGERTVV
jgi:hypothetical protein